MLQTKYHPHRALRLYQSEPFCDCVQATIDLQATLQAEGGEAAESAYLAYGNDNIMELLENDLAKMVLPTVLDHLNEDGQQIESAVQHFVTGGSNIFDFSLLAEMFRYTSVDEVAVADLRLPYDTFYMHFGENAGIRSPYQGVLVDGCYVRVHRDEGDEAISLEFVCTFPEADHMETLGPAERFLRLMRLYSCRLQFDESIPTSIASCSGPEWSASSAWWQGFVEAPMRAAVNALCYLSYPDRDIEKTWSGKAPERLVRLAASAKPTERRRAISKLTSLGFTQIQLCGRRHAEKFTQARGPGTTPLSHWRRGHWRHQAYGTGRTERRLIWIWPTFVSSAADNDQSIEGHLYKVRPNEADNTSDL